MDKSIKLERYREANKTALKGQIVFAGSSLMEQFPVEKLLRERGVDVTVYNRGIGGYVTREMLENLDVCVTDLMPRRVFINIGTNDLSDAGISFGELMGRYDQIVTTIEQRVPGVEIYMMAYYPINYDAAADFMKPGLLIRTNEKINAANTLVEQLAAKHGQRYIDVNRALKDDQGRLRAEYTIEGMHIREEGYRAIMDDLIPYVTEA
ncbi:MAG: lysophospholipase [Clostridiales bacterium]|nr:lysophospholipase [Clostridiales bacterium]